MVLKTSKTLYSRVTLIPWSAMDTKTQEIPERGLYWGTRECNFVINDGTAHPIQAKIRLIAKLKGSK